MFRKKARGNQVLKLELANVVPQTPDNLTVLSESDTPGDDVCIVILADIRARLFVHVRSILFRRYHNSISVFADDLDPRKAPNIPQGVHHGPIIARDL
jgi:hypothetical protein